METGIAIFDNPEFGQVRVIENNGQLWFVAKDVATALDYPESSLNQVNNLFRHVPEEWTTHNPIMVSVGNGARQEREVLCLSEQGLYFFLGRSDKEKALPYQMWIAKDVVPSIVHTGSYSIDKRPTVMAYEEAESAARVTKLVLEAAGLSPNQVAIGISNTYRSQTGIDVLLASQAELPSPVQKQALTPTEIGAELGGLSARKINKLLAVNGYQEVRINGGYDPTEKGGPYALLLDTAKRHSDGTPVKQLKWYTSILPIIKAWLAE